MEQIVVATWGLVIATILLGGVSVVQYWTLRGEAESARQREAEQTKLLASQTEALILSAKAAQASADALQANVLATKELAAATKSNATASSVSAAALQSAAAMLELQAREGAQNLNAQEAMASAITEALTGKKFRLPDVG
jgi:hypothetical protein